MGDFRELGISPLLRECFLRTETACVRECCGLDAFEPDAATIRAWAGEVGRDRAMDALAEVRQLIVACEDESVVVSCGFLNAGTPNEEARGEFLEFLRRYEMTLAES